MWVNSCSDQADHCCTFFAETTLCEGICQWFFVVYCTKLSIL